jgi:hypothetical protein
MTTVAMRFSPSTLSFYPEEFGYALERLPADLVEVPAEDFAAASARAPGQTLAFRRGRVVVRDAAPLTLEQRRAVLWAQVKDRRDACIDAGCTVPGLGRFDTDAASRANVAGAAMRATIAAGASQAFAIDWKRADNTIVLLRGADMLVVAEAIFDRTASCHARSQRLGLAIGAAKSGADLDAIEATCADGWPS